MSLLDDLLRMVGTSRTRIRWRWDRFKAGLGKSARSAENRSRALRYEHKICPKCQHPAGRDEVKCSRCDTELGGVMRNRAGRALAGVLPEGTPLYTLLLVMVCGALYFVTVRMVEGGQIFRGPVGLAAAKAGALLPELALEHGQWWRFITSCFLHGSLIHLAFNMVALAQLGAAFEQRWGRQRFLAVFVITGIAGMLVSAWWRQRQGQPALVLGASGAVFGVMGAGITSLVRRGSRGLAHMKERLVSWAVFGLIMSFQGNIDMMAHLGGLVSGLVLGLIIADHDSPRRWLRWRWPLVVLELALIGLVIAAFVVNQRWVSKWM